MPSHYERARARARLAETPAPVDVDRLRQLEEEAAAIILEAKGRELASAVDDVSRGYYYYLMRRRHRGHRSPGGDA